LALAYSTQNNILHENVGVQGEPNLETCEN